MKDLQRILTALRFANADSFQALSALLDRLPVQSRTEAEPDRKARPALRLVCRRTDEPVPALRGQGFSPEIATSRHTARLAP
ncbi:MAG: hypothetical protein WHV61_07375 [Burkholderiales bacterium]